MTGVRRGASGTADVDDGGAPVEDLAHRRLQVRGVDAGHDLGEAFAHVLGSGEAVHPGEGVVDAQETQVGAEGGQADGRLAEEALQGRERVPHAQDLGGLYGDQERPGPSARVGGGDDPHLHRHLVAVAVAHPEGSDHGLPGVDAAGQLVGEFTVALGDEQRGGGPAEDVLGPVAEQVLGGQRPFRDASVRVLAPQGDRQQFAQHTRVPDSRGGLFRYRSRRLVSVHRTT